MFKVFSAERTHLTRAATGEEVLRVKKSTVLRPTQQMVTVASMILMVTVGSACVLVILALPLRFTLDQIRMGASIVLGVIGVAAFLWAGDEVEEETDYEDP